MNSIDGKVGAMSDALAQMRAMRTQASGGASSASGAGGVGGLGGLGSLGGLGGAQSADAASGTDGASFASMLHASLAKVSDSQQQSLAKAHAFEMGSSDVSLSDVMIDMQKANIQFQTAVQVRNKLVSAYNDIMQMQV